MQTSHKRISVPQDQQLAVQISWQNRGIQAYQDRVLCFCWQSSFPQCGSDAYSSKKIWSCCFRWNPHAHGKDRWFITRVSFFHSLSIGYWVTTKRNLNISSILHKCWRGNFFVQVSMYKYSSSLSVSYLWKSLMIFSIFRLQTGHRFWSLLVTFLAHP